MLKASSSVRRSNDEIRALVFRACANLVAGVPNLQRGLDLNAFPISCSNKFGQLLVSELLRSLHVIGKVVARVFIIGDVVMQMDRIEQNQLRAKLFC